MCVVQPSLACARRRRTCGRKNYRLQDIQLSKMPEASSRQLQLPAVLSARRRAVRRFVVTSFSQIFASGVPRRLDAGSWRLEADMENTGLEPVTSWLQTRRSPS
jgi:hypothetical protein